MSLISRMEGSVIPLRMRQGERRLGSLADNSLRVGRVIRVHAPGASTNLNKRFFEYDVLCVVGGGGTDTEHTFVLPRCRISSAFGGGADFTRWTPRLATGDPTQPDGGAGSIVLVKQINGSPFGGIIVGGPQQAVVGEKDDESDGHHATFQFNGLRMEINSDGDLVVFRKGATDPFGTKLDPADPEGSKIQLIHGGDVAIDAMKDFRVLSQQSTIMEATLETNIKSGIAINTDSPRVRLGSERALDSMIKGTTYRVAESTSNATLIAALTALRRAMTALASALPPLTTATTPPVPLAPTFAGAAAALGAAAAALSTFEAGSVSYLSTHNFLD